MNKVAIIGNGPAGLMAASQLSILGYSVDLFDQNSGVGRKLLIAGSSGLNIGNDDSISRFNKMILHDNPLIDFSFMFQKFFTNEWLEFINQQLKIPTFLGTSGRYFIEDMNSARFIQNWVSFLESRGVNFHKNSTLQDFEPLLDSTIKLSLSLPTEIPKSFGPYAAVGMFLGGGSWQTHTLSWPSLFALKGYKVLPFISQNVGFHLEGLDAKFFIEAQFQPIKDCILKTSLGEKRGDILVTDYGIEGTPVYHVGTTGSALIDLLPQIDELELIEIINKLGKKENIKPMRRLKNIRGLGLAAQALVFHTFKNQTNLSVEQLAKYLKNFPIQLGVSRPLSEAISSAGGLSLLAVDNNLMSKHHRGIFFGGEMLNWTAPTGGYLIQTCVTQGYIAAMSINSFVKRKNI
jgi:predicted Rossmann fold flavoprotein